MDINILAFFKSRNQHSLNSISNNILAESLILHFFYIFQYFIFIFRTTHNPIRIYKYFRNHLYSDIVK